MRVLIAEDDAVTRKILTTNLEKWGYEVLVTTNGEDALKVMTGDNAPSLAILDWVMPGMDGIDLCRAIRNHDSDRFVYLIMMTSKSEMDDIVVGFEAGFDDYLIKQNDSREFHHRVKAGERIVNLQLSLEQKIIELKDAMTNIRKLKGIIPICAWCKRVRTDELYFQAVEEYLAENVEIEFTHGICPECAGKLSEMQS